MIDDFYYKFSNPLRGFYDKMRSECLLKMENGDSVESIFRFIVGTIRANGFDVPETSQELEELTNCNLSDLVIHGFYQICCFNCTICVITFYGERSDSARFAFHVRVVYRREQVMSMPIP